MNTRHAILLLLALTATLSAATAPATQPTTAPALRFGHPVPAIDADTLDNKPLTLTPYKGKPLVIQFASITNPVARLRAPETEKLAADFANKAAFLLIYTQESNPADGPAPLDINAEESFNFAAPATIAERRKLAAAFKDRLNITRQTIAVDDWSNATFQRFGSRPNMTFILDAKGNLAAVYPWMDAKKVRGALTELLANKPVSAANQGPVRSDPGELKPAANPGRAGGIGAIAVYLDTLDLTDKQKAAIFPPLTQYLADLRALREAPTPLSPAGTQPATKAVDALQTARASAAKLKAALKENLPADEYKQAMEALNQGPARRLFND